MFLCATIARYFNIMEEKNKVLHVEKLNVYYRTGGVFAGKDSRKQIIKNVSLDIYEGEMVGLLGGSGCGKSTLGKAILGLIPDVEGVIEHYSDMPQMIFQDPKGSLNPAMTVQRILEEPLRIKGGYTKEEMKQKAEEMLKDVDLGPEYLLRKPDELSGGQRQRVCIALSLMNNPKLLIADEAVSALDVTVQAQIMRLFKEVNRKYGVAILFISHDLKVVYQLCDRVLVMKDGFITLEASDEEIKNIHEKGLNR